MSLAKRIGKAISAGDIGAIEGLLSDDFVWHSSSPVLPDLTRDYEGLSGLSARLAYITGGAFKTEAISQNAAGDELFVSHVRPKNAPKNEPADAVVIWRAHHGRIAEIWDMPALCSTQ